jgi:tetratricopeptide (TPR) repeat protein
MNCDDINNHDLLYEYVDGRLNDDQAEVLEAHLHVCVTCREEEIRLRSLIADISGLPLESQDVSVLNQPTRSEEPKEITDQYIFALRIALATRDFRAAQELVDFHFATLMTLDPDQKNAARLLALFARWMDMGYAHIGVGESGSSLSLLDMLKSCLQRFPQAPRFLVCLQDVVYIRMASGYVALAEYRHEDALADFSLVVSVLPEMGDDELGALAQYGIAKVFRRGGDYDNAGPHVADAIRLAERANRAKMAAGFSILHAWLRFQAGDTHIAKQLLRKAEAVLRSTEDHLRLGNIQSAFGRIARREGRYHDALRNFGLALSEYVKWSPKHQNNGRTYVNRAFVSRLLALRATKQVSGETVAKELRDSARSDLEKAWDIYSNLNHVRGQAGHKVVSALLYLDAGEFERADSEAEEAYQLGAAKADMIVSARARLVQCITENTRIEKAQVKPYDRDASLERALTCAAEAIMLAANTQNKRLQARGHIWHGLTLLLRGCDNSLESATECLERGKLLLDPPGGGYAAEEIQLLEERLKSTRRLEVVPENRRHVRVPC